MKKQLINLFGCTTLILGSMNANAQSWLPNGNFAPDWTLNDINGNPHHLYSLLDQGYTVYLDFSATWCGPCWNYHTGGINGTGPLHILWEDHGPAGQPGVSLSTTNDVWVFLIEAEGSNNAACLHGMAGCIGPNGGTQGDWVTGTHYPIIDNSSLNAPYSIPWFPTIYCICPDRTITYTGMVSASNQYAARNNCSVSVGVNDGGTHVLPDMNLDLRSCDSASVSTVLINYGTNTLTSADIEVYVDAVLQKTVPWTGNLAIYDHAIVSLGKVAAVGAGSHTVTFTVTNPNGSTDAQASNNNSTATITIIPTIGGPAINEDFSGFFAFPPQNWWVIQGSDEIHNWGLITGQQMDGTTGAMSYIQFYEMNTGVDEMILAGVNLSTATSASCTFDIAHRQYSSGDNDMLKVFASTDCGKNWTQVYAKYGAALATVSGYITSEYFPQGAGDWRHETIDLNTYAGNPNVIVKFQATSGSGNNLYIDNINVNSGATAIKEMDEAFGLDVYPNPANDQLNVALNMVFSENVVIEIRNSIGQLVQTLNQQNVARGEQVFNINVGSLKNGVYLVHVKVGNMMAIEKITIVK